MRQKGYTLVELLIGISIVSIVFGLGLAGYRDFSRRQELTGVVKSIVADLRLSQQLSLNGQKPNHVICTRLESYTFIRTSSSSYNLVANCLENDYIFKSVTLPENVALSVGSIAFKVLGLGTDLTAPLTLTISNPLTEISGTITIGIGGNVE